MADKNVKKKKSGSKKLRREITNKRKGEMLDELERSGGKMSETARKLNIDRRHLQKLKEDESRIREAIRNGHGDKTRINNGADRTKESHSIVITSKKKKSEPYTTYGMFFFVYSCRYDKLKFV